MPNDFVGWLNRILGALLFGGLLALGLHLAGASQEVCAAVGGVGTLLVLVAGDKLFYGAWHAWGIWNFWR